MHNDYPLAPGKLEISQNILSKHCSNIANEYGIKTGGVNKLVPNFGNKSKYIHSRNLQLYLSLGIKLTKVHRILKSDWLIKRKYDAKLFSLVYKIKTEDVCEDFCEDKNLFDFSDYLQDSFFLILSI